MQSVEEIVERLYTIVIMVFGSLLEIVAGSSSRLEVIGKIQGLVQ